MRTSKLHRGAQVARAAVAHAVPFGQGGYQPPEFIKRYMPRRYFGLLIGDEGHEFKNDGSTQGQAFGVLASQCRKSRLLSGTLMGGYADDVYFLLFRLNPAAMIEDRSVVRAGPSCAHVGSSRT